MNSVFSVKPSSKTGRMCSRGIWDETIPGIRFDRLAQSNYACLYDKLCQAYPRGETGKKRWEILTSQIKKDGRGKTYDSIIGISGGTDSSYLLHVLRSQGFRPLAVHLDNGFNSEISVNNIRKLTQALYVDYETFNVNLAEINDLIRCYMRAGLPWIDLPGDLAIKSSLYRIAAREGIKYIFRGNDFRTEGSQPLQWTYGDGRQLRHLHKKFGKVNLTTFPNQTFRHLALDGFFRGIRNIYPFQYLDYSKKEARKCLRDEYKWEYYGGHHYENQFTQFAITCWAYDKFGIDKRKISLSAEVLSGEISRAEALDTIRHPPIPAEAKENLISHILDKLEMPRSEYDFLVNSPGHQFTDYPSYYPALQLSGIVSSALLKRFLHHTPQFLFKEEILSKI